MSPEKRFNAFKTVVGKENLITLENSMLTTSYNRLVLTRRLSELAISILLIFGGQLFVIQNNFFCPIWAGTGVALSAIFLRGNFLLAGIFLGTLSSYLYNHFSWEMSLFQSALFSCYIYLIRACCLRFIGPITPLASIRVFWKFLIVIVILTAFDVSIIYLLLSTKQVLTTSFMNFFFLSFLGQLNGILCITPLCLLFDPFIPERYFRITNWPWWVGAMGIVGGQFLYNLSPQCIFSIGLSLSFMMCLYFFGKKFGQFPTCLALLGISVIYLGMTTSSFTLFQNTCPPILTLFFLTLIVITALYSATSHQEKNLRSPSH